jgi:hypothetical protein
MLYYLNGVLIKRELPFQHDGQPLRSIRFLEWLMISIDACGPWSSGCWSSAFLPCLQLGKTWATQFTSVVIEHIWYWSVDFFFEEAYFQFARSKTLSSLCQNTLIQNQSKGVGFRGGDKFGSLDSVKVG